MSFIDSSSTDSWSLNCSSSEHSATDNGYHRIPSIISFYLDTTSSSSSQSSSDRFSIRQLQRLRSDINKRSHIVMDVKGNLYQGYKGELKLSIYMNCGLLTVHVKQGRYFRPRVAEPCSVYIKVHLSPSVTDDTCCKTCEVTGYCNPVFNEKLSFELGEEDYNKRVFVSAWNHAGDQEECCECLGSMSFGIRHILQQPVEGWFYLLAFDIGKIKHRRVYNHRMRRKAHRRRRKLLTIDVDDKSETIERHMIVIEECNGGRGFSVCGGNPTYVASVHTGSAAEAAGLRVGDKVITVDGVNVISLSSDSVAVLVRRSLGRHVTLEIQRSISSIQPDMSPECHRQCNGGSLLPADKSHIRHFQSVYRTKTTAGIATKTLTASRNRQRKPNLSSTQKHQSQFGTTGQASEAQCLSQLDKSPLHKPARTISNESCKVQHLCQSPGRCTDRFIYSDKSQSPQHHVAHRDSIRRLRHPSNTHLVNGACSQGDQMHQPTDVSSHCADVASLDNVGELSKSCCSRLASSDCLSENLYTCLPSMSVGDVPSSVTDNFKDCVRHKEPGSQCAGDGIYEVMSGQRHTESQYIDMSGLSTQLQQFTTDTLHQFKPLHQGRDLTTESHYEILDSRKQESALETVSVTVTGDNHENVYEVIGSDRDVSAQRLDPLGLGLLQLAAGPVGCSQPSHDNNRSPEQLMETKADKHGSRKVSPKMSKHKRRHIAFKQFFSGSFGKLL